MINIYCLIHPDTRRPFYVGATMHSITLRLSSHIGEVNIYHMKYWNDKHRYIYSIIQDGNKPKIRLLKAVPLNEADHYEEFFYKMFIKQGYTLLQASRRFNYKENTKRLERLRRRNHRLRKYMQLCYKDILIIIW